MIEREVLDVLTKPGAEDRSYSFVIEWRQAPDESLFRNASTKRDRLNCLRDFYWSVKSPLIEELQHAGAEVRDLPASAQAIVTATGQDWLRLASGSLGRAESVRVLPNVMFGTAV